MKRLIVMSGEDRKGRVAATFRLGADGVVVVNASEGTRYGFGLDRLVAGARYKPSDGQAYLDALERLYAQRSYVRIDTVPDDSDDQPEPPPPVDNP